MVVRVVGALEAASHRDAVLDVWSQSFGPVADDHEWTSTVWERHRGRADYRLALAEVEGRLVGFAWGYTGEVGQYWPDLVSQTLGPVVTDWVGGHFEFVELAVTPGMRGRGIGGALHDHVLQDVPHPCALLGTSTEPTDPAVRLYLSRGWRPLGNLGPDAQVMGIRHPGRRWSRSRPTPGG